MRGHGSWIVVVVAAALIETTMLPAISIQRVVPDLVLISVVYFSIVEGSERGMFTGLLGGILQDVFANTGVGHHVLCLVVVGYVVGRMASRLITDNPYVKVMTVFGASVVHGFVYLAIEYIQKVDAEAAVMMTYSIMPQAFYTAAFTPVIFFLVGRVRPAPVPTQGYSL